MKTGKNMERLTSRHEDGFAVIPVGMGPEACERLAAYEDTGIEPQQVMEYAKYAEKHVAYMAREGMFIARPDVELLIGVGADRWKELAVAEKEGRLVVLPCKVGDWVYALWDVPTDYKYVIYCAEVKEICHSVRNCRLTTTYRLEPIEYRGRRKEYRDDDFGKLFFLTREEAETALQERADEKRGPKSGEKRSRSVVRVNVKTGEVARFNSVNEARDSIGNSNISMSLLTNRPIKGYRFYYAEDWRGSGGNGISGS